DPQYIHGRVNLGNLLYLEKNYTGAFARFQEVYRELEKRQAAESKLALALLVNMSKACDRLQRYGESERYLDKVREIDPARVAVLDSPSQGKSSDDRAAQDEDPIREIRFVDEEMQE
ncbi:MAG: tetratricopeptide repeat protein, partial [Chloroflexi bacterium]|nr:tetratricopeptide repeat protein [Chloroflexota bacterium]